LTLICAPAGYGKSTLAAQWARQLPIPWSWVTFDEADNNPRSFFGLILAGLRRIDAQLCASTEELLSRPGPANARALAQQLTDDLSVATRPFAMVLDDYHTIVAPDLHEMVELLLQHATLMRLVLVGRTEPPLRLARFRANGEICEIRQRELAFSDAETAQFYRRSFGLDLSPSEVGVLRARTEGWVAGLQLAGVALRGNLRAKRRQSALRFAGSGSIDDQYLWDEVLQAQPEKVRSFLLRVSVLDRFTAELCEAVTGRPDSDELIRRCDQNNLFVVPLDGIGAWYRFHQLFADVLRARLVSSISPEELDDLHQRASAWFEEAGLVEDAVRHAVAGHDWDRAIGLLEGRCATLYALDHVALLRDWLRGLPDLIFERSPRLAFWLAWASGRTGRWAEGEGPLLFAERAWTRANNRAGQGALLLWQACRALYRYDNVQAIDLAGRALALLPEERAVDRIYALATMANAHVFHGEPAIAEHAFAELRALAGAAGLPWFHLFEMAYSTLALIQRGRLRESAVLCRRVIQASGERPVEFWVQAALCHLGSIYLEQDRRDEAVECLRRADELAEMTGALHWRERICTGLARLAWVSGDRQAAFDLLERGQGYATQLGNEQQVRNIDVWRARFWLAANELGPVRRWANSFKWDASRPPDYERQVESLTYVRFLIRDGRADLALSILEAIGRQSRAAGRDGELVEVSILAALAHAARGNAADAGRSLQRALELGEPEGYVRVFVDEGQALASLVRHEALRDDQRAYAQRLVTENEGSAPADPPDPLDSPDMLSEREIEVLRFVSLGLTNAEVGAQLFISEKTVKKHMNNVLRKLGAVNRTHAVDRVRHLRLI
jgi:LuxR family maltose regulon positive regulatory protein